MPDPRPHPDQVPINRVAKVALYAGVLIMALKFVVFAITNSAAVLTDALESIVNLVAAAMMIYSLKVAYLPADREHPYGHGKIEFMAVGIEGSLIFGAGALIVWESLHRLFGENHLNTARLSTGIWMELLVVVLSLLLAVYVWRLGAVYKSPTVIADGKHLMTDVVSTVGGMIGMGLVMVTGHAWLDPAVALVIAVIIFYTSARLLHQSVNGLMDRIDDHDEALIRQILDEEVKGGSIRAYHKVRHRHNGTFHWVDMHLQVDADMSVHESHDLATRIERRIETELGEADATAHIEPFTEHHLERE